MLGRRSHAMTDARPSGEDWEKACHRHRGGYRALLASLDPHSRLDFECRMCISVLDHIEREARRIAGEKKQ